MQVWPTLTTQIPSPDTVLRLASSPAFDPSCSREEWGLLALVDGNRSVNEIVALLGRSEFAVAGALAALVERGLLTVERGRFRAGRPPAPAGHHRRDRDRWQRRGRPPPAGPAQRDPTPVRQRR